MQSMAIFFIKMSGPGGWGIILQEELHVKFDSIIEVGFASSPHKIFLFFQTGSQATATPWLTL
jgi:hypothetical protein